jgi:hypothetical protein
MADQFTFTEFVWRFVILFAGNIAAHYFIEATKRASKQKQ